MEISWTPGIVVVVIVGILLVVTALILIIRTREAKISGSIRWMDRGDSLRRSGRYEEAIKCYDKAIEIDPRDASAWKDKGDALRKLGRHEEAIHCYNNALALDPDFESAWQALVEAEQAKQVEDRKRERQRVLAEAERAKQVEDSKAEIIAKIDEELGE